MHELELIDRVCELDSATDSILCEKAVPASSPVFKGHFPQFPVVPGVLLLESMAQAGGYLVMGRLAMRRMALMVLVRKARFYHFVRPGDQMQVRGRLRQLQRSSAVVDGEVWVNGRCCSRAQIVYRLVEFPTRETRELIESRMGYRAAA